jgi:methionyl-tRNA formyltransferase
VEEKKEEKNKTMKIIFMGTPGFAVPALEALINAGHEIAVVFTQPDKPKGRGQKIQFSPVKEYAQSKNIRIEQPLSLRRDENVLMLIKEINPDVIIVAAYGQILPREILDVPRLGCVNIHASLLPRWRGASPINYCIMSGDTETGITIQQMETGIDTGDILLCGKCSIGAETNAAELHDTLSEMGAKLIVEFMEVPDEYIKNKTAQEEAFATHAPLITKEMKRIDRNKSAVEIHNFIRGLSGEAFDIIDEKRFKIHSSVIAEESNTHNFEIICGDGKILRILELQPEGKRKMSAEEYLRGIR